MTRRSSSSSSSSRRGLRRPGAAPRHHPMRTSHPSCARTDAARQDPSAVPCAPHPGQPAHHDIRPGAGPRVGWAGWVGGWRVDRAVGWAGSSSSGGEENSADRHPAAAAGCSDSCYLRRHFPPRCSLLLCQHPHGPPPLPRASPVCPRMHAVRPGYEVGYKLDDKYYVNNHLMFKVLVHETNGQYTMSQQTEAELEAAAAVEVRGLVLGGGEVGGGGEGRSAVRRSAVLAWEECAGPGFAAARGAGQSGPACRRWHRSRLMLWSVACAAPPPAACRRAAAGC